MVAAPRRLEIIVGGRTNSLCLWLPNDVAVKLLLLLLLILRGGELVDYWIVNQVEDINDKSDGIVDIASARLLHWDPMLVNDVWLVHVEDLNVIRECLSTDLEVTTAEWTLSRDFKQFDVVADLCEVDLFVQHKSFLQKIG
jgi:hypothetical protein